MHALALNLGNALEYRLYLFFFFYLFHFFLFFVFLYMGAFRFIGGLFSLDFKCKSWHYDVDFFL